MKYRVTEPPGVLAVVRIKPSCWQPLRRGPPDNIGKNPFLYSCQSFHPERRLHSIILDCGNQLELEFLHYVSCVGSPVLNYIYDSVRDSLIGTTDIGKTNPGLHHCILCCPIKE